MIRPKTSVETIRAPCPQCSRSVEWSPWPANEPEVYSAEEHCEPATDQTCLGTLFARRPSQLIKVEVRP